jgi:bifunctional UDP-N-acetylglucosamine pyrophosphorylase/glucosamine-1-phosphate N-acetyltransferase
MSKRAAIILAAGKGTRMQSDLPKCFHRLCGRPLLERVIGAVKTAGVEKIFIVVGHQKDLIMDYFKSWPVEFVIQSEQLGTGHAVMQAEPLLKSFDGTILVLAGDMPLITAKTLKELIDFHERKRAKATDLTAKLDDAGSYGRIIRNSKGEIQRIVEAKDATPEQLKIQEINTGIFAFDGKGLFDILREIRTENRQKEYYLTDVIEILEKKGQPVSAFMTENANESLGVNTKEELAQMERNLLK